MWLSRQSTLGIVHSPRAHDHLEPAHCVVSELTCVLKLHQKKKIVSADMSKNIAEMPMLGLLEQLWLGDTALDDEALS